MFSQVHEYFYLYSIEDCLKIRQAFKCLPIHGCKMLFHCGFNLHFPNEVNIFSCVYQPFGFLLNNRLVLVFSCFQLRCLFLNWCAAVLYIFWILILYWYYVLQISSSRLWLSFLFTLFWWGVLYFKVVEFVSLFLYDKWFV